MLGFVIRHPTVANLLMMGLILLGLTALPNLKRETFPEYSPPYINASVVYPGASPQEVEESLCLRLEDAVDGLNNTVEVRCDAQEGLAKLTIKLTEDADMGRSLLDVQTQINAVKDFPQEIEPPIVKEQDWADNVVDIAVAADASWPHLKAYAEDLKRRLKIDAGVKLVTITGFSDHQLRIEVDTEAVRRLGLTIADIADKVSRQNVKMPAGTIELADKNLLIRFDERKVTPNELAKTVIASNNDGAVVRLSDIASVTDRFELDEEQIRFNGKPAALIKIQKNKAEDALRVKARVQEFVDQERLRAPEGVTLTLTNDMSSLVSDRLNMMLKNGWQGIILVFFSMWLFFSLRYSFWVSAGLPVAFMGGLFLMGLMGLSINIMSLVALLMAIGIMMDDAIVIAESIASHVERGLKPAEAVIEGVKKVAPGVCSSFLTTIFILGSLLWLEGQMGAVLKVVPMALILVLAISLLEAFIILPAHLYHSLESTERKAKLPQKAPHPLVARATGFKNNFHQKFEKFRQNKLRRAVTWVVHRRYLAIGATFGLLLASFALVAGGALKFVAFPELDGDIAEARIILPPGATLSQTQSVVKKVIAAAEQTTAKYEREFEDGEPLVLDITAQYNFNADASEKGPHLATVRLDLLSAEVRETLIDDFIHDWRDATGEQALPLSMVFKQPSMGPAGRDIEIRLMHDSLPDLKLASQDLQQRLKKYDGVYGVLDDMRVGKAELQVSLLPGAEVYGVDGQTIASQLRGAYFGQTADEIQVGPENLKIEVRLDKQQAGDLTALENFPVMLQDGSQIPLSAVAQIEHQRNFVRIQRINGLRTVSVMADVDYSRANNNEILAELQQGFLSDLQAKYPGLRVEFEGSAKESQTTGSSLGKGFAIGLFGLFAVLSVQFRSYQEPFVIMAAIPLALIGVLWGHLLLGHSLSMPSIMGFISLAGIVVNDSILLVQYIRHHLKRGEEVIGAVIEASVERFRAVLLTSLTTAAGLLPLMLETSLQAQVVKPLVISIVFGIFASTMLVLFIIPAAYAVLADQDWMSKHHEDQMESPEAAKS
ncbi:efflux RND transporter permease subunit [Paraferrimonas sedimenticola]|uniref:Acriflavin resistance protein n=1 Tax=Paraferrimonas sedimenticola TaxID=375674 RepID=A0AA37W296_9GAMM|nr:efflux RND transporter permease subunit [Paraferrimonas sedimenticola]GLP97795.1 acriflavin resistance protein [Paraferrimonas sedimenticola]